MGANSGLHIIIFDELDAICKQRGSVASGAGVHDTVVNQLLSKIDGVKQLNNILVIGERPPVWGLWCVWFGLGRRVVTSGARSAERSSYLNQ